MDFPPFTAEVTRPRWRLSEPARAIVSRAVLALLVVIALDGAYTWYVTGRAVGVVSDIELRDGTVRVDESDLGLAHRAEIARAAGGDADRIRLGAVKWLPAALIALAAGLFASRADPRLRSSIVMAVALTLAIWVSPRVVYSLQMPVLDAVFG